jgi:hypothetical protein
MTTTKQGLLLTHAIAVTAILIAAAGWQTQVYQAPAQTGFADPGEINFLSR